MSDIIKTKIIINNNDNKNINVTINKTEYDNSSIDRGFFYAAKILNALQENGIKLGVILVQNGDKYITSQNFIDVCKTTHKDIINKGYINVYTKEYLNYYDTIIIGAGVNGLFTAIKLKNSTNRICVIDKREELFALNQVVALNTAALLYITKAFKEKETNDAFVEKIKEYSCLTTYPWFTADIRCIKYTNDIVQFWNDNSTTYRSDSSSLIKFCGPNNIFIQNKCLVSSIRLGDLSRVLYDFAEKIGVVIIKNKKIHNIDTDDNSISIIENQKIDNIDTDDNSISIIENQKIDNIDTDDNSISIIENQKIDNIDTDDNSISIIENQKIDNIDTDDNSISIIENQKIDNIDTDDNSISITDNDNDSNKLVYRYDNSLIFTIGRLKEPSENDAVTKKILEIMGFDDENNKNELYNLRSPGMTNEKINSILKFDLGKPYVNFDIPREESFDCYGFAAIFTVNDSSRGILKEFTAAEFEDLTKNKYNNLLKFRKAQHRIRFFMEPNNEVYIGIQISKKEYETYVEQQKTYVEQQKTSSLDDIDLIKLGKNYIKTIYYINGKEDVEVSTVGRKNSYNVFNSSPHIVKKPFCFKENASGVTTVYGFIGDAALSANFATAGGINIGTFFAHLLLSNAIKKLPSEEEFNRISNVMKSFMRLQLFPWSWEIYHDNIYKIDKAVGLAQNDIYKQMGSWLIDKDNDTKLIEKLGEDEFKKICFSTLKNEEISKLLLLNEQKNDYDNTII